MLQCKAEPIDLRRVLVSAFVVLAAALSVSPVHAATSKALSFGIVPQQSATRLAQIWIPFLQQLSRSSKVEIRFATAKDIPTFEACLAKSAYDIAYMNPHHYTTFHTVTGYRAFARQKGKLLEGLIVVRKNDPARDLKGLDGKKIAFPSPAAFGASVIPRAEMEKKGIRFEPVYVKSHDSVYRAVSSGLIPAGGGVLRTFNSIAPEMRGELKIIYRTAGYTPHAFAAHPRVDRRTVEAIALAMAAMKKTSPAAVAPLGMKAIQQASDEDWNDVRSLNLKRSETNIVSGETGACRSD